MQPKHPEKQKAPAAPDLPKPGDPADLAVVRLLDLHGGRLYGLGMRLCGNHQDAQDLIQETFLQVFRKWEQFEGRSSVTTWLYTIAARTCKRMHRRRAGQPARMESLQELLPFGEPMMATLSDAADDPAEAFNRKDLRRRMEQAIGNLPGPFRMPLILKDIAELSLDEIAAVLGLKPETVKTRVHRARLRLRKELVRTLPKTDGATPAYSKRMCLDLLEAKQEALDRGVPFPVGEGVFCDRCRSVFNTLDLGTGLCKQIGRGALPGEVREAIAREIDAAD